MRLAILSDIHEDYEGLKNIVGKAEAHGFDKLICLGDISGFSLPYYQYGKSRNASACLALLREKCDLIVAGNHDIHAAGLEPDLPDILKGMDTWEHEKDLDPGYSESDIRFLAALPVFEVLPTPAGQILLSHYAYPNLTGFVQGFYSWEGEYKAHFAFMQKHQCSLSFTGHAHPRGFYKVGPMGFKQYRRRGIKIRSFPAVIGIPPATRHKQQSSFCIFDSISLRLKVFS